MPTATGHDLHIDQNLTKVAINYSPATLIAPQIAPVVPVAKQSDYYVVWDQGDILRVETDNRAPGTEANKITRSVSSGQYYADNYALKTQLTLEDRENMDAVYVKELRGGRAKYVVDKLGLGWEKRCADICTSGGNVYSYSAVASAWTEFRNGYSDPLTDILTGLDVIQDATGIRPNSCLMGGQAWRNFRWHADIIDALHGDTGRGNPRFATREQAKSLLEVDRFIVGEGYYNSAAEGQSQTLTPIWADHVLLYYAPLAPTTEDASFMYTFRWSKPGLPTMTVERHPFDSKTKAEEIEVGVYQDEVVTASTLAYLITNVTSST
jgi:hypothetical protein